jgi:protein disulfide-isomerase
LSRTALKACGSIFVEKLSNNNDALKLASMTLKNMKYILSIFMIVWVGTILAETKVCEVNVPAFDPANPEKQIGDFTPGSKLEISGAEDAKGMIPVSFTLPNGQVIKAVCRKTDLDKKPEAAEPAAAVAAPKVEAKPKGTDTSVWITDHTKALEIAKNEGKYVLLDFTGSDWCGWCMKLDKEVFHEQAFKDYAKENLVLVTLDFPHKKALPASLKKQNDKLAEKYQIQGYPSIVVLNSKGDQIGATGYVEGGPTAFIEELKKIMTTDPAKKKKEFQKLH